MVTIEDLKRHYLFTDEDAELLASFLPVAEEHKEKITDDLYDYLLGIPETAAFLQDDAVLQRLKISQQAWLVDLFSGKYDNHYLRKLEKIGLAHVRIGLNAHFVNCAMNFIRQVLVNLIRETYPDREMRRKLTDAAEKILDANLDVMSASYLEEELRKEFVSHRLESMLIRATERFTYGLNLILGRIKYNSFFNNICSHFSYPNSITHNRSKGRFSNRINPHTYYSSGFNGFLINCRFSFWQSIKAGIG